MSSAKYNFKYISELTREVEELKNKLKTQMSAHVTHKKDDILLKEQNLENKVFYLMAPQKLKYYVLGSHELKYLNHRFTRKGYLIGLNYLEKVKQRKILSVILL